MSWRSRRGLVAHVGFQHTGGTHSFEGGAGLIVDTLDADGGAAVAGDNALFLQTHHRQEGVVIEPQTIIEVVEGPGLSDRVER